MKYYTGVCAIRKAVPVVDCSSVTDGSTMTVSLVNRSEQKADCSPELTGISSAAQIIHVFFDASVEQPVEKDCGSYRALKLPSLSWNMARIG